ncbi:hypothetical protein QBC35DRAFT_392186 [Podospora australis]|uniref:Rhodopsin domain-containing protein n=1 Tax=Podospora australis TaxID=1536484 RepID=A0AAN6WLT2_9PEZI|nr:hypothetical protein QBC35DRAFT_392186 [Podospora australis]
MSTQIKFDPTIDYGPQLNATVWLLVSVSTIFLFTRLYLKNCQNRGLWWDDYFLLASWLALVGQAGLVVYVIGLGYGKQLIPAVNFPYFPVPINILSTLLILANLMGKISFAVTLLRIPERWMRVCVWFILVTLASTLVMSVVLVWVSCVDRRLAGRCVDKEVSTGYNIFSCVYSAVMDVALAFLPWKFLWALQMSTKEKMGVVVAMSMGIFAGAAAGIKSSVLPIVGKSLDPKTAASVPLIIWGNAEAAICIMAASIPILRALARGRSRGPVPQGYETYDYETGQTAMTEFSLGSNAFRRALAEPVPPPATHTHKEYASRQSLEVLDETLTNSSPEPSIVCKNKGQPMDDDDNASFEMTDYRNDSRPQSPESSGRPMSPVDFVGRVPAPR